MESSRHIRNKNVIKHKIYKNLIKQSFLFVVIEIIGNVMYRYWAPGQGSL